MITSSHFVRRAVETDAQAIAGLYRELVDDPAVHVLPEQIGELSRSGGSFLLVVEGNGLVHATALLTICPDVMYCAQPFGVIENIVVSRRMRGQGLGFLLMDHMEHLARSRDCTKLMLSSSANRAEAHAFFTRCGYAGDSKRAFVKYRSQW